MSPISAQEFSLKTINNSFIVRSTRVDKTIKAIINSFKLNSEIVNYLNRLRIVYYLNRLNYLDQNRYKTTLSKFSIFLFF